MYLLKHVKSRCASCRTLRRILQNVAIHRRGANSWARSQHMIDRGRRQGKPYIQCFSSLFSLEYCASGGISREVVRSHGTNHGASHGIPREVSCAISRVFPAACGGIPQENLLWETLWPVAACPAAPLQPSRHVVVTVAECRGISWCPTTRRSMP